MTLRLSGIIIAVVMGKCRFCDEETLLSVDGMPVCLRRECDTAAAEMRTRSLTARAEAQRTRPKKEIERILSVELSTATARHAAALAKFHAILEDMHGELPAPDGTLRIRRSGAEIHAAFESVRAALDRFNGFVLHGIVPDDLHTRTPGAVSGKSVKRAAV